MRAIMFDRIGGPEVLRLGDLEKPAPRPGDILVEVAYAGVNPADWKVREGWLADRFTYRFPFVPGFDAAGRVAAVGEGVTGFAVGDLVVTSPNQGNGEWGGYAEFVRVDAQRSVRLPPGFDLVVAGGLRTAGVTAWEGIFETGKVAAGQTVLVHGGAGGCGSFAIGLARMLGARVATTCGPANLDYVRSLGAELAIDYRQNRVKETLLAWAPGGVDYLLDTVGQGTIPDGVEMVKPGGMLAPIVTLIQNEPLADPGRAAARGVRLGLAHTNQARIGADLQGLVDALASGRIKPPQSELVPLANAAEAQERVKQGHVRGKLVLQVADPASWR